ncbi:MAG: GH3 auxin-responsive promoter family protein [Chloroflexi bacterium]|nr:GH3 auxin-responsive promoter family protein [Chloroflexota bacterium]
MSTAEKLLKQGRKNEIWTKYCGFLDLSQDEFMEIQERLLMEQINFLKNSEIGKKLLGDNSPTSLEEFRRKVSLTTYQDYELQLKDKNADILPFEPFAWARTSGRSGEFSAKWAPYTKRMYDSLGEVSAGALILSSCSRKGEIYLEPNDIILLATAPPPYTSGHISHSVEDNLPVKFVPSLEEGEKMDFGGRIAEGFNLAMGTGLDYFFGLSSILTKIGERFENGSGNGSFSLANLNFKMLPRLAKGMLKSKLNGRAPLPQDFWDLKGIMSGGTDTNIYRDRIKHYWGKEPLEGYACTEGGNMAVQAWNYKGMTFFPDINFLEFIPFEEHLKSKDDPSYQPETLLYTELQLGIYELVFTNLLGGVFTRYRVGDLIEVTALRDDELNIDLPQIRFYSRADDLIDLAGFTRLTESSIWQVIEAAGVEYEDWTARKEEADGEPILHIYIEPKETYKISLEELKSLIRAGLHQIIPDFADLENMMGRDYLKVSQIQPGSFMKYMEARRSEGADLAHIKPPHMQAPDIVMDRLLQV